MNKKNLNFQKTDNAFAQSSSNNINHCINFCGVLEYFLEKVQFDFGILNTFLPLLKLLMF